MHPFCVVLFTCCALLEQSSAAPRSSRSADSGLELEHTDSIIVTDTQQEAHRLDSILSQLLGDYDKVKATSEGSDCHCKCVVRPLSRSACRRIEEGDARVEDFYTVETITNGPNCKCACIAPPSAVNPCEGKLRLKKLRETGNIKLSTILDLLEGSFYDHIEKVVRRNKSHDEADSLQSPTLQAEDNNDSPQTQSLHDLHTKKMSKFPSQTSEDKFVGESPSDIHIQSSAEVIEMSAQDTPKNFVNQVTKKGPNGLIIRGMTFYKSESDPMVADDGEPGENLFEYDSFSGDGPINLLIEENLLQHKTPRPRTKPGQKAFKSKTKHLFSNYRKTSQYGKFKETGPTRESSTIPFEITTTFPSASSSWQYSQKHTSTPKPWLIDLTVEPRATTVDPIPSPGHTVTKDSSEAFITSRTLPTTVKISGPKLQDQTSTSGPTSARATTLPLSAFTIPNLKSTSALSTEATESQPMKEEKFHERKPADCKDTLATISEPVTHNTYGRSEGAWMKDSVSDSGKIYVTNYFYGNNLLEFASLEVFKQGHFTNSYKLPYNWIGTGHVVYRGAFYYNRAFSRDIIKFDLHHRYVAAWTMLHDAVFEESSSPWEWRSYSDINIAVDESGLWIIYPALDDEGFLQEVVVLSRLNPEDLSMQKETTWRTGLRRNQYGNCFIVCGVLYFVDSYNRREANLEYAFDTHTNTQMIPRMPFTNNYTYTTQLDYNPKDGLLYAWDNGHQVTYNISFAFVES
ncbi:hypothetical protein WMY93_024488 [Mugilogobius chulae]|uniref:Olfactomedin-like domain-containing protein n=1 Tax=Mugilogobius chulae TaxID=88201 RepID=A0AAW0N354_9GOBI